MGFCLKWRLLETPSPNFVKVDLQQWRWQVTTRRQKERRDVEPLPSSSSLSALDMYSNALRWWCFCCAKTGAPGRTAKPPPAPPGGPRPGDPVPGRTISTTDDVDDDDALLVCCSTTVCTAVSDDAWVRVARTCDPTRQTRDSSNHSWKATKRTTWKARMTGCANRCTLRLCTVSGPGCCVPSAEPACCCLPFNVVRLRPTIRPICRHAWSLTL